MKETKNMETASPSLYLHQRPDKNIETELTAPSGKVLTIWGHLLTICWRRC